MREALRLAFLPLPRSSRRVLGAGLLVVELLLCLSANVSKEVGRILTEKEQDLNDPLAKVEC